MRTRLRLPSPLPNPAWGPLWASLGVGLVACDAEHLSAGEAQETFQAINEVTSEVVWSSRETIEQGARATLEVAEDERNVDLSGPVLGSTWEGSVHVDGQVTDEGSRFAYALVITCDEVTVADGPTVDGELEVTFYIDNLSAKAAADLQWSLGISITGALAVSGEATGLAEIAYDLTLRIDGFSIAFEAQGTINGYDVSDWGYAFSL